MEHLVYVGGAEQLGLPVDHYLARGLARQVLLGLLHLGLQLGHALSRLRVVAGLHLAQPLRRLLAVVRLQGRKYVLLVGR